MEQEQLAPETVEQETFPLDGVAIEMVDEICRQLDPLNVSLQTVLVYFTKQHGLQGRWQLAPSRRELVKTG